MKVLFDHPQPFALSHGGFQIQIEQTKAALERIGLHVEFLRWWDDSQRGDIIHFFGRMPAIQIELAHKKSIAVVMAELLTATGSRSKVQLSLQRIISRTIERIAPPYFLNSFNWDSFRLADACVALTPWEAHLMNYLFDAPSDRVHIVANGVEDIFLRSQPTERGNWLICAATITERKRVLELARAAVLARTPTWIIGKAYSESDPYVREFLALARRHPDMVRYEGPVEDRVALAGYLRAARGFVLLSTMESLSLSALEAAACGCPLLLTQLPWAKCTFSDGASYCPISSPERTAEHLKRFYDEAPSLKRSPTPLSWEEVAARLKTIYERILSTSR